MSKRAQAADEESVGFKAGYNLAFNAGLRVYMEPEYCHPAWNNLKNSIKVAGFHPTLLKATLMSHVNHSPYGSGKNQQTKEEVCCHLVESMKVEDFQRLCEDLEFDRGPSGVPVPTRPEELLSEPTIAKRGIYVPCYLHSKIFVPICQTQCLLRSFYSFNDISKYKLKILGSISCFSLQTCSGSRL